MLSQWYCIQCKQFVCRSAAPEVGASDYLIICWFKDSFSSFEFERTQIVIGQVGSMLAHAANMLIRDCIHNDDEHIKTL